MSKIDSKPNFLVTFLSSTSRKRMWTYNFLTKSECFQRFQASIILVELKKVTKKFGLESIFDIFFRENLMRILENVEKSLTFRQLSQANRSLKTLKNTRFQSKSCMSTHVSYWQSAKKDNFFLILETSLKSYFQTQNVLYFEASKIKLKIVASKLNLWV